MQITNSSRNPINVACIFLQQKKEKHAYTDLNIGKVGEELRKATLALWLEVLNPIIDVKLTL